MMDAVLVEHFHAAHRQRRTGMLLVSGETGEAHFAFQEGNPVAIDFGVDKERLLADALLEHHRITAEFHQALLAVYRSGQASVAETVLRHQAASEDELARTTQAMVEDALCRAFTGRSGKVDFQDGVPADTLDFALRAFRLRIDAEVLLRTTRQRVEEIRAVAADDPGWAAVYSLSESAGSSELSAFEKLVLNVVDGRRPVAELAVACRDSCHNLARTLRGLAAKGVVQRVQAKAVTAVAPMAAAPAARPPEFVPVRRIAVEEPPLISLRLALMIAALVVAVAVGWLVVVYEKKRRALQESTDRIGELLGRSQWQGAQDLISEAERQAGNDLEAKREVDGFRQMVVRALKGERDSILRLVETGDFAGARKRIAAYPPAPEVEELRVAVVRAEKLQAERAAALVAQVEDLLRRGDIAGAAQVAGAGEARPARDHEAALEALDRWRAARLDEAAVAGAPLRARREALTRLATGVPSQGQAATAERIQAEVVQAEQALRQHLDRLGRVVDGGDAEAAATELERLRLAELSEGLPWSREVALLRARIERLRAEGEDLRRRAVAAVRDPAAKLDQAIAGVEGLAARSSGAVVKEAQEIAGLLRALQQQSDDRTPSERAVAIRALTAGRTLPPAVATALAERADRIERIEKVAGEELELARRARREGEFARARTLLIAMTARIDLRRTEALRQAENELVEVEAAIVHREGLKKDLERAVGAGDVAAAGALAREMGLRYLPLAVDSLPQGAEVRREGRLLGATPLLLDIPAADRVDADFEISAPGYQTRVVKGAEAEAGWRLLARLERTVVASGRIPQTVTSRPSAVGGVVVVASRLGAGLIAGDGSVTHVPFGGVAVENPIYAAASGGDGVVIIPTRDRIALRLQGKSVERLSLPVGTDLAPALYRSDLVVGRRLVVVAGDDGRLCAGDESGGLGWSGAPGAPFAAAPLVIGERVLSVRRDGRLEQHGVEDGHLVPAASAAVGAPVLAAWAIAGGFAGLTATDHWRWQGGAVTRQALPIPAAICGERVIISTSGRVLVEEGGTWNEVGRSDKAPTAEIVAWKGHAVLPQGNVLVVLGKRGFALRGKADFLAGAVLGERLVAVDQAGQVQVFDP